jgi:formamidopyrimidine-DNA glycosylase
LLAGAQIDRLQRHGKQLALIARDGRCLVVQLGMTGQLLLSTRPAAARLSHVHALWSIAADGDPCLVFRDPRRFGGLWPAASPAALASRWRALGPDALTIAPDQLAAGFAHSRRPIKSALLDQALLAGVGNIYADEALFAARIAPRRLAHRVRPTEINALAQCVRAVLSASIDAGGSTLRDFVDGAGNPGTYRDRHQVYGRAGLPCPVCGTALRSALIAQRTSVWCRRCQH